MSRKPDEVFAAPLSVRALNGRIWSHIRQDWFIETPEERVRQEFVCTLFNEYGYDLPQMQEEMTPPGVRGTAGARADVVVWRSPAEKIGGEKPLIVVECKADNVAIDQTTYQQGGNYANWCKAPFFVTHNHRQTKYWKVDHSKLAPNYAEIKDIPDSKATQRDIDELLASLRAFREDEFADLLHQCHNVIRNREHLDPAAAFDEIAKILFVKVWCERRMRDQGEKRNLFTVAVLKQQISNDPINQLFKGTRDDFRQDRIFADDERINLRPPTVEEIVRQLEAYNLSDTSEDVKGIAFERFLGRTFRGEIGQFFTPRSIVEFMIRMVEPREGEVICDPASGSGGFLIRFFELVREQIAADVDAQYKQFAGTVAARKLPAEKKAKLLREKWADLQHELDPAPDVPGRDGREHSRVWQLANRCIYGTDANDRMARTSKMNMIMHGDGHGGVHHHNGFLNVNGIFEGRFNIILTNPPFGANVEPSDIIQAERVKVPADIREKYRAAYGEDYDRAAARVANAVGSPIGSLFTLPKDAKGKVTGKIKTEILFIERCLDLLMPGGRLGIVLPEGVFNNPSLAYVREFVEDRAFLRAVVSLPQETFFSSGASVKASLLFLQKFTVGEQEQFDATKATARAETAAGYAPEMDARRAETEEKVKQASCLLPDQKRLTPEARAAIAAMRKELAAYQAEMEQKIQSEARALLKQRCKYPVFLYDAAKVGITATGEPDQNELYPNDRQPSDCARTCVELYREFRTDPTPFFVPGPGK